MNTDNRFNTQPPEGGWVNWGQKDARYVVSTHSRPKAAGGCSYALFLGLLCFNTQPPEGGWAWRCYPYPPLDGFNTQPPEGGWHAIYHMDKLLL